MTVIGAIATPYQPPERLREVARIADESGLDELWLWEDAFYVGGVSSAAAILGATERLRVGIGVLPFPLRNVALAAMEVATLERMFPGRFLPGFGHGVQDWMGQAGVRPASVLTLEREYVTALRALLAGEEVTVAGDYVRLTGVKLSWPPVAAPPLHLAASGPKSLVLSGALGDGTVLDASARLDDLPRMLDLVAQGRREADRAGEHQITYFLPARPGDAGVTTTIRDLAALGVHRVLLQPPEGESERSGDLVRFVAEELQPLFA
jgi:alkanesulfonate monooxygenase SsuD/methylene tetrahydromethanopterin reductase-like flavin-dependent oxidoreductase (luciferase family)